MNLTELTSVATTLRQIEAQIVALRGSFLLAGDIAFSRQCNDIGLLVSDLLEGVQRHEAADAIMSMAGSGGRLMPAADAFVLLLPQPHLTQLSSEAGEEIENLANLAQYHDAQLGNLLVDVRLVVFCHAASRTASASSTASSVWDFAPNGLNFTKRGPSRSFSLTVHFEARSAGLC